MFLLIRQSGSLRAMNRAIFVIGWRIKRVEFQWFIGGSVYNIVARAGGNNHYEAISEAVFYSVKYCLPLPRFTADKLVKLMHLFANIFQRLQTHDHELAAFCRVKHFPKILIRERELLNICDISFHCLSVPEI